MGEKNIHVVSEVPNLIHPQADKRETAWCGMDFCTTKHKCRALQLGRAGASQDPSRHRDPTGGLGTLAAHILGTVLNGDWEVVAK